MPQNPPPGDHHKYTYDRNDQGIIRRSDGALVPLHEPDNPVTKLFQEWLAAGNKEPPELTEEQKQRERERLNPPMPDTEVTGPQGHRAGWNEDSDAP